MTTNVYLLLPVADFSEATKCAWRWTPLGYKVVYLFDTKTLKNDDPQTLVDQGIIHEFIIVDDYAGWYSSVNFLMSLYSDSFSWCICAGSDMDPENNKLANDIALECTEHFNGTYGIMQPTGDRWDERNGLAASERICGSPWIGQELVKKCEGKIFSEEFFHYFSDELLREYAIKDNILWQRKDLTHLHRHPNREHRIKPGYLGKTWGSDQKIFNQIKDSWIPAWREGRNICA